MAPRSGLILAGILAASGAVAGASMVSDTDSADALAFGGPSSILGQLESDQAPKASLLDVDRAMRPLRGLTAVPFSNAGSILANLYGQPSLADNRLA